MCKPYFVSFLFHVLQRTCMQYILGWLSQDYLSGFQMFPLDLKAVMVVIALNNNGCNALKIQGHFSSLKSLFSNTLLSASIASLLEAHKR